MDVRGWADIAYNFVIDPRTLVVYEGRGWGVRPAAQRNYNNRTWAVAVMGDYRSLTPSRGLLGTVAALARHGHQLGFLPLTLTGGHRDAPGQVTTCPGDNLWAAIPEIRSRLALEDDMWTRELDEESWRALARSGIAAGAEEAVVDYWWTKRAERTDAEHREASANMSATIAVRVATGTAGPPGPPGPPGRDGKPVTLTLTGDAQLP